MKYVAYYRVSTQKQGNSGLGLEAQQRAARSLAEQRGATIIAEFTEVETGKSTTRSQLAEALKHAKLTHSTLVVAKLDRLARNAGFMHHLKEARQPFICCDNPNANELTIDLLSVIAEHEAKAISTRTKEALQSAKLRGTKLGSAREGHWKGREDARLAGAKKASPLGCEANRRNSRAYYDLVMPRIMEEREAGATLQTIAEGLNANGFQTRWGKTFTHSTVRMLLERI
jgi:DNA invertase Pin-like site-specific DNA recombinase